MSAALVAAPRRGACTAERRHRVLDRRADPARSGRRRPDHQAATFATLAGRLAASAARLAELESYVADLRRGVCGGLTFAPAIHRAVGPAERGTA